MPAIKVYDINPEPPTKLDSDPVENGSKIRKRTISQQNHPDKTSLSIPDENTDHDHRNRQPATGFMAFINGIQNGMSDFYSSYGRRIRIGCGISILIAYHVYFGFAVYHSFQKALALVVLTIIAWLGVLYYFLVKPKLGPIVSSIFYEPAVKLLGKIFRYTVVKGLVYVAILAAIAVFLAFDTADDRYRLMSLTGLAFYILVLFIFSKDPASVQWRPVLGGLLVQFILGLLVLRWPIGSMAFSWASDQFSAFLSYTKNGTGFVYGFVASPPPICGIGPVFAFSAIQTVLYFSGVISLLYYLGVMQYVIKQIAWIMTFTLGTTAVESLNAAANIFLGQTEAPLMIRPYMNRMTESELFATMTGGFATVAGSVFAAYVAFGACPNYLLSASVMSATGSLAVSKLFYPETQESKCKKIDDLKVETGNESNILEAISNGASNGIFLIANIVANLLVFLALLAFLDNVLIWLGDMVGIEGLTFERLCSYIFFPLAYIMGAGQDTNDVMKVAELMGVKTFLNEFIAYQKMGEYVRQNEISPRAQVVATYALCGFSNLGSIGIQLGGFSAMCPEKKSTFARMVLRSCIAGSITTFITACIAGLLTVEPQSCGGAIAMANCTCLDPTSINFLKAAPSC